MIKSNRSKFINISSLLLLILITSLIVRCSLDGESREKVFLDERETKRLIIPTSISDWGGFPENPTDVPISELNTRGFKYVNPEDLIGFSFGVYFIPKREVYSKRKKMYVYIFNFKSKSALDYNWVRLGAGYPRFREGNTMTVMKVPYGWGPREYIRILSDEQEKIFFLDVVDNYHQRTKAQMLLGYTDREHNQGVNLIEALKKRYY